MTSEFGWAEKLLADFGVMGVMVFGLVLLCRLADKWAAKFLDAQIGQTAAMTSQAAAMTSLASVVREGQSDQREVLIAVRVLADRINSHKDYLEAIERTCRERGCVG